MTTTRRSFLIGGLQVTALPWISSALTRSAHRSESPSRAAEPVLVVVQLGGGNDGLNTVVPRRQDAYFRSRPNLGLAPSSLLALDDEQGFHPSLRGFDELFARGRLAVLQRVGYPEPDRSHFRSMEIWHMADPVGEPAGVGWMGRLADQIVARRPGAMAALHVGGGDLPLALRARDSFTPTARDEGGFALRGSAAFARWRAALLDLDGAAQVDATAGFLRDAARTSYRAAERMAHLAERGSRVEYPGFELARRLRLVARLVAGGFDTRLFLVELGGFDTHAHQAPVHAALLAELGASLTAFQRDLEASGVAERVVTLVFSEFGRRVEENGSRGTDHGAAAPAFLVGAPVRGGLYGPTPDLERLEDGDVPFAIDFRSVYTSLERDWMGLAPSTSLPALDVLGG